MPIFGSIPRQRRRREVGIRCGRLTPTSDGLASSEHARAREREMTDPTSATPPPRSGSGFGSTATARPPPCAAHHYLPLVLPPFRITLGSSCARVVPCMGHAASATPQPTRSQRATPGPHADRCSCSAILSGAPEYTTAFTAREGRKATSIRGRSDASPIVRWTAAGLCQTVLNVLRRGRGAMPRPSLPATRTLLIPHSNSQTALP